VQIITAETPDFEIVGLVSILGCFFSNGFLRVASSGQGPGSNYMENSVKIQHANSESAMKRTKHKKRKANSAKYFPYCRSSHPQILVFGKFFGKSKGF
jgi:hypothetical protein